MKQLNKSRLFLILIIALVSLSLVFSLSIVLASPPNPVAVGDEFETKEDTILHEPASGILGNDSPITATAVLNSLPITGVLDLITSTGEFTYTPPLNFNGVVTFTYFAEADDTLSDLAAVVTITITAVNDDPVLTTYAALNIAENQTLSITTSHLQAADVDNTDLELLFTLQTTPTYGNLSLNGSNLAVAGTFTQEDINQNLLAYTHGGNEVETDDNFQFSVSDGVTGSIASTLFQIPITLINDPPIANDDTGTTSEETAVSTQVLLNDSDIDGSVVTSTLVITSSPANGLAAIDFLNGSVIYTPTLDFNGNDSLDYQVCDDGAPLPRQCVTATVALTVTAVNDAPVAVDDNNSTDEESALNPAAPGVLNNDIDADIIYGDAITVTNADSSSVNGAAVAVSPDGSYTYDPAVSSVLNALAPGESITDTFTYTIRDTAGLTDTAVVRIAVSGVNDPPTAVDDIGSTNENNPLTITAPGVLNNDTDPDTNDSPTVTNYDLFSVNGAAINVSANGGYTYNPTGATDLQALDDGDSINDTFGYTITDGFGGSDTATVTITVGGLNDAPQLNNSGNMRLNDISEDTTTTGDLVISILASDLINPIADVDASAVDGIAVIDVTDENGQWQYTINGGANWLPFGAVFNSSAVLLDGASSMARIRFVPVANYSGSAGTITFRAWDQTIGANGQTGYNITATGGTTAFSSALETATLTVNPVNDAPVLNNSGNMVLPNIQEDTTNPPGDRVASIIASDLPNPITDVDAGAVEGVAVFSVDNSDGSWEYSTTGGVIWTPFSVSSTSATLLNPQAYIRFVPDPNYFGPAGNIAFRAWDQSLYANGNTGVNVNINGGTTPFSSASETATLTVNSVNDIPHLDLNGNGGGTGFSATFIEDGGPIPVVDTDLSATDIDDNFFNSATATLTNPQDGTAESLAATASGPITAIYNSSTGILSLAGTDSKANYETVLRSIKYNNTSQDPDNTARVIEITVNDGEDDSNTTVSIVTVSPVNDTPVIAANTGLIVNEGGTGTITNGRLQVTDVDNTISQLIYTIEAIPVNGQLLFNGTPQARNGQFSQEDVDNNRLKYTHDGSETSIDTFDFTVSDSSGGLISLTTFTITTNANNDLPILAVNNELTVDEGSSRTMASSFLQVTDADNTPDQLVYRLEIIPVNGVLKKNGIDLALNAEFFQEDIDNNVITYVHNGGETTADAFTFAVEDGAGGSIPSSVFNIAVTPINDLPVMDLNGSSSGSNFVANFIEDGGAIAIVANDLTLNDADNSTMASATAVLTNHPDGAAESLSATVAGTSITANYVPATGILTLTGPDSLAHFQMALQSLTYNNTSQDPSTANRTIEITANDGQDNSVARISLISITSINDAPALATNAGLTIDAGKSEPLDATMLRVTDADNSAAELTYTLLSIPTHGVLKLNGSGLSVNGTFTQDDVNNNRLIYEHDDSKTIADSFDFVAVDGSGSAISNSTFDIVIRPKPQIFLPVVVSNYVVGEPNDSSCEAHGIDMNRAYEFAADDLEDWYVFTLTSAGSLTFNITNYIPSEGQLVIYKGASCAPASLQQKGHDSTITPTGKIELTGQTPGVFYVRVISEPIPTNSTLYKLEVVFQ